MESCLDHHNCTFVDQLIKRYFLPLSYSIIFIVGLVGNVTSIAVYLTKLRPWKSSSIIMVNLALTDLLYVLSMPFLVYYYSNGESWTLGDFMCRFVRFGFHFNLYGSILFLTCHAVFRYFVVMRPLMAAQVQETFWGIVACLSVWIITAIEVTPMLTMITLKVDNNSNKMYCLDFASSISGKHWYSWLLTTVGFLLPLVVVFICYISIMRKLTEGPCMSISHRMRARRVTMLILVVFIMCFLPYHVLREMRLRMQKTTPCMVERVVHTAYIISRPLAGLNTCFNLALYTLSGDKFKGAFFSTFHWKCWLTKASSLLHKVFASKASDDRAAV